MDDRDRHAIETLFEKIAAVEQRSGPRDAEAEGFIRSEIVRQPAAPYYMAQTIVVQEAALSEAQRRIDELEDEQRRQPAGEGFLGGLFGGGSRQRGRPAYEPWGPSRGGGRGFLAGAAETAMGVAGGILLGNMLGGMFSADPAEAASGQLDQIQDVPADTGGDVGDFDLGDF